jgi:hypothetical protein
MTPLTLAMALVLAIEPSYYDRVLLSNGGLLRGVVIVEAQGPDLVVEMPDGTRRVIPRAEVTQVDVARPPPATEGGPGAEEALVPLERYDAVVLLGGQVLRGTVIEDVPGRDLWFQSPDGSLASVPRTEVAKVALASPPPAEAPAAPPPAATPPPEEPAPFYGAVTIGAAIPTGTLAGNLELGRAVGTSFAMGLEGALRLNRWLHLGAYLRFTAGSMASPIKELCGDCVADDFGGGLLVRWSFAPTGAWNPWLSLGLGIEYLFDETNGTFGYLGWELGGAVGIDYRLSSSVGIGLYVGTRWGRFFSSDVYVPLPTVADGEAWHGWVDVGVRFVMGP